MKKHLRILKVSEVLSRNGHGSMSLKDVAKHEAPSKEEVINKPLLYTYMFFIFAIWQESHSANQSFSKSCMLATIQQCN